MVALFFTSETAYALYSSETAYALYIFKNFYFFFTRFSARVGGRFLNNSLKLR